MEINLTIAQKGNGSKRWLLPAWLLSADLTGWVQRFDAHKRGGAAWGTFVRTRTPRLPGPRALTLAGLIALLSPLGSGCAGGGDAEDAMPATGSGGTMAAGRGGTGADEYRGDRGVRRQETGVVWDSRRRTGKGAGYRKRDDWHKVSRDRAGRVRHVSALAADWAEGADPGIAPAAWRHPTRQD